MLENITRRYFKHIIDLIKKKISKTNLNNNSQFDCRKSNVSNNLDLNSVHENNFKLTSNNNCIPPVAENLSNENLIYNNSDFSNNGDNNYNTTQLFNSSSNGLPDNVNPRNKI